MGASPAEWSFKRQLSRIATPEWTLNATIALENFSHKVGRMSPALGRTTA